MGKSPSEQIAVIFDDKALIAKNAAAGARTKWQEAIEKREELVWRNAAHILRACGTLVFATTPKEVEDICVLAARDALSFEDARELQRRVLRLMGRG